MGSLILLDSVILIDHFNGKPGARLYLTQVWKECFTSAITRAEVLAGFDLNGREAAINFLDQFPVINIDAKIADFAAELRRLHRWKLPDAIQAAVALSENMQLATRNTKDFPPEVHAFVVVPYILAV